MSQEQENITNDFLNIYDQLLDQNYPDNGSSNKVTTIEKKLRQKLKDLFFQLDEKSRNELVNNFDHLNNSLLSESVSYGNESLSLLLIELGFDINHANVNGKSILILAINNNLVSIAEHLLDLNVQVDYARLDRLNNKVGATALQFSCQNGLPSVCDKLIKKGANINYQNDLGDFALLYAIKNDKNHLKCFKHLMNEPEIEIHLQNKLSYGVFERIIKYGNFDFLSLFIEKGGYDEKIYQRLLEQFENDIGFKPSNDDKNTKIVAKELLDEVPILQLTYKLQQELNHQNKAMKKHKI